MFDALQRKAQPDLEELLGGTHVPQRIRAAIMALPNLLGGANVITLARQQLVGAPAAVDVALDELENLAACGGATL